MVTAQERVRRQAIDVVRGRINAQRQREAQAQYEAQQRQVQEEEQPQTKIAIIETSKASKNIGKRETTLETFDTIEEAEARLNTKITNPRSDFQGRNIYFDRDVSIKEIPIERAEVGTRVEVSNPLSPSFERSERLRRQGGGRQEITSQSVVDVQTGQNVAMRESSQYIQKQNLEKAIKEKPQLSFLRKDLYPQIEQPKEFTKEAAIARRPRDITITGRETAGELIKQLPPNFRTTENQRRLAEEQLKQREIREQEDFRESLNRLGFIGGQYEISNKDNFNLDRDNNFNSNSSLDNDRLRQSIFSGGIIREPNRSINVDSPPILSDTLGLQKTKTPESFISKRDVGFLEDLRIKRIVSQKEGNPLKSITLGTTGLLLNILKGVGEAIISPFRPSTYKSLFKFVTNKEARTKAGLDFGSILRENPEQAIGGTAGNIAGGKFFGTYITPIAKKPFQSAYAKLSPRYVEYKGSGIRLVEGTTIPTPLNILQRFEGTKQTTIHTTLSPQLKYGVTLQAGEKGSVGAFRTSINQYNFYQSLPKNKKALAYGGYIGIGDTYSAGTKQVFSLINPTPKAFIFRNQFISPTPKGLLKKGIKEVVTFQTTKAGTYIPAENLFGRSVERQAATSVGLKESPLFKIEKNPKGALEGRFTYYNQKKPLPDFLGGGSKGEKLVKDIISNPKDYTINPINPSIKVSNKQLGKVLTTLQGENIAITGGLARKIATGKGRLRDLDIVTLNNEGKLLAEKVAAKYPNEFEVIQHKKFPDIYRLKDVKTGKVIADFDPLTLAEEGLINPKSSFYEVQGFKVVKPEVLLKSKAKQIEAGKITGQGKQFKNIEQLTGQKNIISKLKSKEVTYNPLVKSVYDFFTSENKRIEFKEAVLSPLAETPKGKGKVIDLLDYSSDYGRIKYITPQSVALKYAPLLSKITQSTTLSPSSKLRLMKSIRSSMVQSSQIKSARSWLSSYGSSSRLKPSSSSKSVSSFFSGGSSNIKSSVSKSNSLFSSSPSLSPSPSISSSFVSSPLKSSSSKGSSGSSSSVSSSIFRSPPYSPSKNKEFLSSKIKELRERAYNVYIKRTQIKQGKGKYKSQGYVKANKEKLDEDSAKGLLFQTLDTYANRSGYIKEVSGQGQRRAELAAKKNLLYKFRANKRNSNIFTEKTAFAIDNPTEVSQIPYEALRQKRNLNFFKTKSRGFAL